MDPYCVHTIRERERKDEESSRYSAHSHLNAKTDSASIHVKAAFRWLNTFLAQAVGGAQTGTRQSTLQLQPGDNDIAVQVRCYAAGFPGMMMQMHVLQ